jgi:hypothetical protein
VNLLESADTGTVEADAVTEQIVVKVFNRQRKMLPHAG